MLCLQLDRPAEAIAPLQSLHARPEPEDADAIRALRAARRGGDLELNVPPPRSVGG